MIPPQQAPAVSRCVDGAASEGDGPVGKWGHLDLSPAGSPGPPHDGSHCGARQPRSGPRSEPHVDNRGSNGGRVRTRDTKCAKCLAQCLAQSKGSLKGALFLNGPHFENRHQGLQFSVLLRTHSRRGMEAEQTQTTVAHCEPISLFYR